MDECRRRHEAADGEFHATGGIFRTRRGGRVLADSRRSSFLCRHATESHYSTADVAEDWAREPGCPSRARCVRKAYSARCSW